MSGTVEKLSTQRVDNSPQWLGYHVSIVAERLQARADASGAILLYDFNGKDIELRPGEDASAAVRRWEMTPWPK
jgi:hypothetical protein